MKKKGLFASVMSAALFLTACGSIVNDDHTAKGEITETGPPAMVNSEGAIVVENGVVVEPVHNHESDAVRVDMFMEPLCPACKVLEQELSGTLSELNENGDVVIYSHPVSFMDAATPEGYSSRAVSTMYGVAEHAPEHYIDYVEALYSDEYFPTQESSVDYLAPEYFVEVATSVGIEEEAAERAVDTYYRDYITEITDHIDENRPEINRSPDGIDQPGISTPTVTVGGEFTEEGQLDGHTRVIFTGSDYEAEFMDALQPYLDERE